MYTLVSASVLALDLARHPKGAEVADVVDRALVLDDVDLRELARSRGVAARARVLDLAGDVPRMTDALRAVTTAAEAGFTLPLTAAASRTLQRALVGRLEDLLVLVEQHLRDQVRLPAGVLDVVLDVVLDKVVAAWAAPSVGLTELGRAWDTAVGQLPPPAPPSLAAPQLLELLEALGRCDARTWTALDDAHARLHSGTSWSALVHEATRSTVEHGRTVQVCRWQLSAVRAAHAAGHAATSCAPGAMMSVVGAVQALCAGSSLPVEVVDLLTGPCRRVLLGRD